ncbi:sulfatase-like hydrolase/transferase [Marinibacterium sp. SX1]|uniref:sulfatase-like hydrolase/transferase n=1 Tax=Marinibacterium sp. SX1 TaxID=3388424 RepID=UPI003D1842A1
MADQLRADYLSCYGHPTLKTPNIDALASKGVRFTRAYVQSPVCGPARMSYYTGRYITSHGATWNNIPLSVGEWTLGDYIRPLGPRVGLVGKTHMRLDVPGFERLGLDPNSERGRYAAECGFEPFARDDGLHPDFIYDPDAAYERYLRNSGYEGKNLWQDWANSGADDDGALLSGWYMRNAGEPARVPDEHSETAWTTDQAMAFIDEQGENPWVLHVSYIKPHWPYIVSAPYHDMFGPEDCLSAVRTEAEREHAHLVFKAFMQHAESQLFSKEEVRLTVAPTYMGLIKQLDDHLGRLMQFLEERGRLDDTMIVFTSDHGDYMGDHWLGEKELFHEQSAGVPLIVVDPSQDAQSRQGTTSSALVEGIDLIPTFVEALGGEIADQRLEGRSILPLIRGADTPSQWRDFAVSELDYSFRQARRDLGLSPAEARAYMIATDRWKFVFFEKLPPQLFDLRNDPQELVDLGVDEGHQNIVREMKDMLFEWGRHRKSRVTMADADVERLSSFADKRLIGLW